MRQHTPSVHLVSLVLHLSSTAHPNFKEIFMSFFDNIVHKVSDGAKKAVDEATSAVDDISHGDIIGAAEHVENIREIPQDTAIEIIKDAI